MKKIFEVVHEEEINGEIKSFVTYIESKNFEDVVIDIVNQAKQYDQTIVSIRFLVDVSKTIKKG